jgi:hypothetical protein
MSVPISVMIHRGRDRSDPGDLIEPLCRVGERGQLGLDLGVEDRDVGVDPVDAGQHPREQEPVVVVEVAGERLDELRNLDAQSGPRHLGEHLGVAFPGNQGCHHLPSRLPRLPTPDRAKSWRTLRIAE